MDAVAQEGLLQEPSLMHMVFAFHGQKHVAEHALGLGHGGRQVKVALLGHQYFMNEIGMVEQDGVIETELAIGERPVFAGHPGDEAKVVGAEFEQTFPRQVMLRAGGKM